MKENKRIKIQKEKRKAKNQETRDFKGHRRWLASYRSPDLTHWQSMVRNKELK